MQEFPHNYNVSATAAVEGNVNLMSDGLSVIESGPPVEFGGDGGQWSPETLLAAAVADCFILSFRAIARTSKFEWVSVNCNVEAVLDRVDKVTKFTEFRQCVVLEIPTGGNEKKARRLLQMAERVCLITNSLSAETVLETTIKASA